MQFVACMLLFRTVNPLRRKELNHPFDMNESSEMKLTKTFRIEMEWSHCVFYIYCMFRSHQFTPNGISLLNRSHAFRIRRVEKQREHHTDTHTHTSYRQSNLYYSLASRFINSNQRSDYCCSKSFVWLFGVRLGSVFVCFFCFFVSKGTMTPAKTIWCRCRVHAKAINYLLSTFEFSWGVCDTILRSRVNCFQFLWNYADRYSRYTDYWTKSLAAVK